MILIPVIASTGDMTALKQEQELIEYDLSVTKDLLTAILHVVTPEQLEKIAYYVRYSVLPSDRGENE
jgi:hypothetical protein